MDRFHQRCRNHDYYAPFIYHIILKKKSFCENFGYLEGDAKIEYGNPGCAEIKYFELGKQIAIATHNFPKRYPATKILQYKVMPDHVHIVFQVLKRTSLCLGQYISALKTSIYQSYSQKIGGKLPKEYIFEAGFCDKPLFYNRKLKTLINYVKQNPHRLAMRQQYPHFFKRSRNIEIAGKTYEAYGNLFLLRNPDKMQVQIHRDTTPSQLEGIREMCIEEGFKHTVMVSPFISSTEKDLRKQIEATGAPIILICHEAFGERFKPAEHNFKLCSEGRLLIISLGMPAGTSLSRAICVEMNKLASKLSDLAG